MKTIKTLALATILGLAGGFASAQDDPIPTPAVKPAAKAVQAPRELANDDIQSMLENMGYEVRFEESEDKKQIWLHVKITRSELGGSFEMSVALSPNKKKIWSHLAIGEMKAEYMENTAAFVKLLELNASEGPNHFRIDEKTKYLYLSRCTDNRALTPALLKEHIENLVEASIRTKDHWTTAKFTSTSTAKK